MNPLCTPCNIILQDITFATNRHHYCTAETYENIRTERQASDIFFSIRRSGISLDSRHLFESNWTLHFSITCISQKIYETRTDEWLSTGINPRVPFLGVDTERDFHPVVSSFHQTYKADQKKKDPVILVPYGHYPHTRNLGVINLARENHVDIICLPLHNSHRMLRLNKAFMRAVKIFYCQEIEK
jgi:hypothetical protein